MYKIRKVQVLGLAMFTMLIAGGNLYAKTTPDCEMGDAVFRLKAWEDILGGGFHHAGIYFCSHSKGDEVYVETTPPYYINITDSDFKHSVIEAVGEHGTVSCQPFVKSYVESPGGYKGAYSSGDLTAEERRKIIATAWEQKGAEYDKDDWPGIKEPKGQDLNDDGVFGSFRCDGLVEYCYEEIGHIGNTAKGNPCMGFFGDTRMGEEHEEENCWLSIAQLIPTIWAAFFVKKDAFYPKALMARMQKAEVYRPQIEYMNFYRADGTPVKFHDRIKGQTIKIKTKVTDRNDGSGIDRVEVYYQKPFGNPVEITTIDKDEDIEKEYEIDWEVPDDFSALSKVYVIAYDRAGNKTEKCRRFWFGSPYHVEEPFEVIIDNEPPEVVNTAPGDGDKKICLGKRIRVTFSEEMDKETINEETILVIAIV